MKKDKIMMQEKLEAAFPLYPIPSFKEIRNPEGFETKRELRPIAGCSWAEVAKNVSYLEEHEYFAGSLSEKGRLYYLPALMSYTYEHTAAEISLPMVCWHMLSFVKCGRCGVDVGVMPEVQASLVKEWIEHCEEIQRKEFEFVQYDQSILEKLYAAFPLKPIPTLKEIKGSYGLECDEDLAPLHGRAWDTVIADTAYLEEHYTFPYWLTKEGILYYLPAIIAYTHEYSKQDMSFPEVSCTMASVVTSAEFGVKLDELPQAQACLIRDWLNYLKLLVIKEG